MTLLVGFAAYLSHQAVRRATLENLKRNAFLEVQCGAQVIDQWIVLRKSESAAIANAPVTQTLDWDQMQPYFQSEYQRLNTFLPNLGMIDAEGKFYNLLKGANNPSLRDRLHFQRGMAGQSTVLDPIISRVNGKPIIVFADPIWSDLTPIQPRRPIGVINAPIGIDKVTEVVQGLKYGQGSYAFALNSKGEAITHPNQELMSTLEKPALSLIQSSDRTLAQIAQQMVQQKAGIELVNLDGQSKYVAFLPLKEANWSIALVIPRDQIESQLRVLDGIAGVVMVLTVGLIAVLVCVQYSEHARLQQAKQLAEAEVARKTAELEVAQLQMIQSEKMSALGNLVAGVAHEINNPISCVIGNTEALQSSMQDLFQIIDLYAQQVHKPTAALEDALEEIDLDYLRADLPKLIRAMQEGGDRICAISRSLRTFARTDRETKQRFDLQEGIESTLLILRHRLKANPQRPEIQIVKQFDLIPTIDCFPGQLNQVLMNLLANAIDALEESNQSRSLVDIQAQPNRITITTKLDENTVKIAIADNGTGMSEAVQAKIFDQSFTTKGVGKGTGLGLAIAKQIITETHGGSITVNSKLNEGTEFLITLPIVKD